MQLHRQIKDKLRRKAASDLDNYFNRFRELQGAIAGEEARDELYRYVNDRNAVAAKALKDRNDSLPAVSSVRCSSYFKHDPPLLAAALSFSVPAPSLPAPYASTLKDKEELESNKN